MGTRASARPCWLLAFPAQAALQGQTVKPLEKIVLGQQAHNLWRQPTGDAPVLLSKASSWVSGDGNLRPVAFPGHRTDWRRLGGRYWNLGAARTDLPTRACSSTTRTGKRPAHSAYPTWGWSSTSCRQPRSASASAVHYLWSEINRYPKNILGRANHRKLTTSW